MSNSAKMSRPWGSSLRAIGIALFGLLLLGGGCHRRDRHQATTPSGDPTDGRPRVSAPPERERCLGTGEETGVDVNNDGRPDIHHVARGGVRYCTVIDLNFDGDIDVTRFYESDGQTPRREEHDFDFDGKIDEVSTFENGHRARMELDTNFEERIDTWIWCENGAAVRSERDRLNTGRVDTWETYQNGVLTQAAYDEDHNDRPEKWEYFTEGRLTALGVDEDADGQADRREPVAQEVAGPADEPVYCDRNLAERMQQAAQPAQGAATASDGGSVPTTAADGGTPSTSAAGDGGAMPWDSVAPLGADAGVPAADGGRP